MEKTEILKIKRKLFVNLLNGENVEKDKLIEDYVKDVRDYIYSSIGDKLSDCITDEDILNELNFDYIYNSIIKLQDKYGKDIFNLDNIRRIEDKCKDEYNLEYFTIQIVKGKDIHPYNLRLYTINLVQCFMSEYGIVYKEDERVDFYNILFILNNLYDIINERIQFVKGIIKEEYEKVKSFFDSNYLLIDFKHKLPDEYYFYDKYFIMNIVYERIFRKGIISPGLLEAIMFGR